MKLKIGFADYTVKALQVETADYANLAGLHKTFRRSILIHPELTPADQASTLIHELIHAAYEVFNIPDKKLSQEEVCQALEKPLACIFRDNPALMGVLHQALDRGVSIVD